MSYKPFLYYLIEEDGRSNYVDNGIVSSRGTPTPLPNTPDGWQDIMIAWEKNVSRHGLVRNYSRELGFVRDGAMILRDGMVNQNVERKLFLLIQRLVLNYGTTYKWVYEYLYKGELDFSTFKSEQDKVKISIMEGGLSAKLKANEATKYTIPFDDDSVNVTMDGLILKGKVNFLFQQGTTIGSSFIDYREGMIFTTRDGEEFGVAAFTVYKGLAGTIDENDDKYFALVPQDILSLRAFGRVFVDPVIAETNYKLIIRRYNPETDTTTDVTIIDQNISSGEQYIDYSVDFSANANDRLYAITKSGVQHDENSILSIEFTYRKAATTVKGFRRRDLFRKLCAKLFGHEDYAISALLDNDDRVVTCGDAIRGLADASIKTSLNDFYSDLDSDLMAGMGLVQGPATVNLPAGPRLSIEARATFYDASNPIPLGEVADFEWSFANDISFNKVKVGWPKPEIEDVNGKSDFNGGQEYTLPITRVAKEYNIVSPYKAGPFEIEITRINLNGKTTTDANNDNDNFVLWCVASQPDVVATVSFVAPNFIFIPNGIEVVAGQRLRFTGSASNDGDYDLQEVLVYPSGQFLRVEPQTVVNEENVSVLIEFVTGRVFDLKRETYDNQADPDDFGVPSPTTVFNVDLSPKRKLRRHGRWLRSVLHNFDGQKVTFQSGDKNTKLKTVQGGVTIKEGADVVVDDLGEKMFLPFYFDFETKVPINLTELLEENTNRCLSFEWEGDTYVGFLFKAGIAPNTQEKQQFKLLASVNNDLTNLIYG